MGELSAAFSERPAFQQALRRPGMTAVSLGLKVGLIAATYRDDGVYCTGWGSGPNLKELA